MAALYLGNFTVGGSIPGLSAAFDAVGTALTDLRATVDEKIGPLSDIAAGLSAQADATGAAKIAIRIPAVADFQAQLDGALSISASLSFAVSNPAAYLQVLLDGLASASASLQLVPPTATLDAQVTAAASLAVDLNARIAAVDLELAALATIEGALRALLDISVAIRIALQAAIDAVQAALDLFAQFAGASGYLTAPGIHVFLYDGLLSGLGAAIDLVTPSSGLSGSANVRVPIIAVDTANTTGLNGVNAVFRTS